MSCWILLMVSELSLVVVFLDLHWMFIGFIMNNTFRWYFDIISTMCSKLKFVILVIEMIESFWIISLTERKPVVLWIISLDTYMCCLLLIWVLCILFPQVSSCFLSICLVSRWEKRMWLSTWCTPKKFVVWSWNCFGQESISWWYCCQFPSYFSPGDAIYSYWQNLDFWILLVVAFGFIFSFCEVWLVL